MQMLACSVRRFQGSAPRVTAPDTGALESQSAHDERSRPKRSRWIGLVLASALLGCTTVKRNAGETFVEHISWPAVGETITVGVGDNMVRQGHIVEENFLVVHEPIDGSFYDIPAKAYPQIGFDEKDDFFNAQGVTRSGLADPVSALALGKEPDSPLRVITTFGASNSYAGSYSRERRLSPRETSFQQTLIYSGRIGDKINVGYCEFSNNLARPAFNNDVEYDLSVSQTIGYKGASLEVIDANNSSITFRLLENFVETRPKPATE